MLTSLYSAVSGLQSNGTEISVIGNNIANANTVGFKAARTTFEDIMSSSLGGGTSLQVGRGSMAATVMPVFTQSSFDTSSNATDLAIDGKGFFVVKNPNDARLYYTRAGDFIFNKDGLLVNPNDYVVQGWMMDQATGETIGDITDIDVSKISSSSKATSEITIGANLQATKEPKFVVNDDNNTLVITNNGNPSQTITIENGIYTGETLAEKLQEKIGIVDFKVSYDEVSGKFIFTNGTANDITMNVTDQNFTIGSLLGFEVIDRDDGDGDSDATTGVDDVTINAGETIKSDTYPKLSVKKFKITEDNNIIKFSIDGGANVLTATLSTGEYTAEPYADGSGNLTTPIAQEIEDELNAALPAGSGLTFDVKFNENDGKFIITATDSSGSDRTIDFYWGDDTIDNDPGEETTASSILGFAKKTKDNENDPDVINSFQLTVPANDSGSITSVYAPNTIFDATTYDYSTAINIYDSLGNPHTVTFYFKKVAQNYWEWHATVSSDELDGAVPDDNGNAQPYEVGNGGILEFNPSGSLKDASGVDEVIFNFAGGAKLLQTVEMDFGTETTSGGSGLDGITQFASSSTTFSQSQDGYPAGTLTGVEVDNYGIISGIYSNGEIKKLAKIAIAKFTNPWELGKIGKNLFAQTVASGDAIIGGAGDGGRGVIVSHALEHSNVDIAEEFVKLISAQRAFQANSRVITTSDQLLMEVVNLKR